MNRLEQIILERISDQENIKKSTEAYLKLLKMARSGDDLLSYITVFNNDGGGISKDEFEISLEFQGYKLDLSVNLDTTENYPAAFINNGSGEYFIDFILHEYDPELYQQFKDIDDWGGDEFDNFVLKNIQKIIPKHLFVHEFTHFLDFISQPEGSWDKYHYGDEWGEKYYNDFKEIQARMIEGFVDYRNDIKRGNYQTFDKFQDSFIDYIFDENWKLISDDNKKRINKRLYSFWKEQIDE